MLFAGCSSSGQSPQASGPQASGGQFDGVIKIGASLSLTGNFAPDAGPVNLGYEFWVNKTNAAGGVNVGGKHYKVELVIQDDGSNREQAVRQVENLITQQKVNFLLAPWGSGNTDAVAAISERYKIPMIAPLAASDAVWTRGYKYLFGTLPKGSDAERPVVRQAAELGVKTMAIAYTDDLFPDLAAQGARDEAAKLGIQVVLDEVYPPGTTDLAALITKLKSANADMVMATADTSDAILLVQQMKEQRYFPKMLGLQGPPVDPAFVPALGADAEDIFGVTWWTDKLTTKDKLFGTAKDFAGDFYKAYGYFPAHDEVSSAVSGLILQLAVEHAGSLDPTAVRDQLAKFDEDTSFGHIKFDAQGINVGSTSYAVQIQKGQRIFVYPKDVRDADPVYPAPGWADRK